MDRHISAPLKEEDINELKMGDYVYITGTVYVARDGAHKRMMELLDEGKELPFDLKDNIIYYMGPSPAREGRPIGSAGPTTASRMDKYAPKLLDLGLKGMIGKGKRSREVIDAIVRNKCVYFAAVGGENLGKLDDLLLCLLGGIGEGEEMHRYEPYAAFGYHVGGNRTVNTSGKQRNADAV